MNKSLKLLLKKNKGSKNKKKFKKPMLIVGGISAIIFIIGIAFSVIISFWLQSEILLIKNNVIPAEELFAKMPRGGAKIYDRNGILLYQFVLD